MADIEPVEPPETTTAPPATGTTTAPPATGPSDEKAAEKYREQRDQARKEVESYKSQLAAIKEKGNVDEVRDELEAAKAKAEEVEKQAERDRVNIGRLAKADCVDIDVALSLLDDNGDVDALKEAKPYLFGAPKGSTGIKPEGAPDDKAEKKAAAWKAAGLPPEKRG